MWLKRFHKSVMQFVFAFIFLFSVLLTTQKSKAQIYAGGNAGAYANTGGGYAGNWGSGYWGGSQGCGYPWRMASGSSSESDEVQELRKQKQQAALTQKSKEKEVDRYQKLIDLIVDKQMSRMFSDDIVEFIAREHIEKENLCSDYKDFSGCGGVKSQAQVSAGKADKDGNPVDQSGNAVDCGSKVEVPKTLKANWNQGKKYCAADINTNRGKVSGSICSDSSLKPEDGKSIYSEQECSKILADLRKYNILRNKAQAEANKAEADYEKYDIAISDKKDREQIDREMRMANQTEAYCEECETQSRGYGYQKQKTNWGSVVGQIGLGLGLGLVGMKYDKAAMEYQAQLGYPPTQGYPTAISMGLPFVLGGVYGAINGGTGQGGFGCASGYGGTGFPYGAGGGMGGPFGGAGGAYGPYASGGAFGYPQGMYGSPWGGGMYMPGYGPGGVMAGPNGGWPWGMNGGMAINGMMNGGYMNPYGGAGGYMSPGYMMPGGGYMMNGGIGAMMNGGYMNPYGGAGGYMSPGYMMPGGGYMMNGGIGAMMNGGYMNPYGGAGGYMMPGGGYMMNGGIGAMANGGYMNPYGGNGYMSNGYGGYPMNGGIGSYMNNPQYQMQLLQMQQQAAQQQMQYYQAQMQQQMQAYQRQMAIQQQAGSIQQEIYSLQMRLQNLYSGGYSLGGGINGGGYIGVGVGVGTAAPSPGGYYPPTNYPTVPQYGTSVPVYPGTGSAVSVPANGSGR